MMKFRVMLALWILGRHCACYNMGYHPLCDFRKRSNKGVSK